MNTITKSTYIDINDITHTDQLEAAGYCAGESTDIAIAFDADGVARSWVHIVEWLHAEYHAPQVFEIVADTYYFYGDFDDAKTAALEIVHTLEGRCLEPTWTLVLRT